MTIKEIEERCGMTRANIRFYEAEGLIDPKRGANGYRDYSEKDLELLMKIKLLRSLDISLEEIKALQAGNEKLTPTLNRHLEKLNEQKQAIEHVKDVCEAMRDDRAEYNTLNVQRYLNYIEKNELQESTTWGYSGLEKDVLPSVIIPWRRYFARILDMNIYWLAWIAFMQLAVNVAIEEISLGRLAAEFIAGYKVSASEILTVVVNWIIGYLLTLLIEPILLTVFGTTFGKWLFGISIRDRHGRKLGYAKALERTWLVLTYGLCLGIPIFEWVRLWISWSSYEEGKTLEWEYNTELLVKDQKKWRMVVCQFAILFVVFLGPIVDRVALMPENLGDITVKEFSGNFNQLSGYLGGIPIDCQIVRVNLFRRKFEFPLSQL